MAMQNLRDRRQRQKHSEIFSGQQSKSEEGAATVAKETGGPERIDLTQQQLAMDQDDQTNTIDDFDLLEAKVDPKDIRSQVKIAQLEDEIESEKIRIKCKFIFKYSFQSTDPLKITE